MKISIINGFIYKPMGVAFNYSQRGASKCEESTRVAKFSLRIVVLNTVEHTIHTS